MAHEYFEHVTKFGERWDLIAYNYYGDATLIKPLLTANSELVGDTSQPTPLVFGAGVRLRVPVLSNEEVDQSKLPPWKRS